MSIPELSYGSRAKDGRGGLGVPRQLFMSGTRASDDSSVKDWRSFLRVQSNEDETVSDAIDRHLEELEQNGSRSLRDFRSAYERVWRPCFGDLDMRTELTPEAIAAVVRAMRADGKAPKTVRRYVSHLSSLCEHARSRGLLDDNPVKRLSRGVLPANRARDETRAASEVLSPEQLAKIWETIKIPYWDRLMFRGLAETGMRPGELWELRRGDISPDEPLRAIIVRRSWDSKDHEVHHTKTCRVRRVPLRRSLAKVLQDSDSYWQHRFQREPGPSDLCFPFDDDVGGPPVRWVETTALRRWHAALGAAGIEHPASGPRRLYCLRHTYVSLAIRHGANQTAVESTTHHTASGKSAFRSYTHLDWPTVCRAVESWPFPAAK